MPDFTTENNETDSAKDFDILPAKLIVLLISALEEISAQPKDNFLLQNNEVLEAILCILSILNCPRRTDHTFVSGIFSNNFLKKF
jgi:hypothetical protein